MHTIPFLSRLPVYFLLLLVLSGSAFSCQSKKQQEQSFKEGERLHARGDRMQANNEYIKAYNKSAPALERSKLSMRIARNFQDARKREEAITWYRTAVSDCNEAKEPAPYVELAKLYTIGDTSEEAKKLLAELEQAKPDGYLDKEKEIARLLIQYHIKKQQPKEAGVFAKKLQSLGKQTKDKAALQYAEKAFQMIQSMPAKKPDPAEE